MQALRHDSGGKLDAACADEIAPIGIVGRELYHFMECQQGKCQSVKKAGAKVAGRKHEKKAKGKKNKYAGY